MKFISKSILILVCVIFIKNVSYCQSNNLKNKIDSLITITIKENNIPALSISVISEGVTFIQEDYGLLKLNNTNRTNENTIYQIASLSKMFTGIIANHLIKEKKLSFDESITKYLGDDISQKAKKRLKNVSIKDLLTHYSGFPRNSKVYKRIDGEPMIIDYSKENLLQDLNRIKLKQYGKYNYSNIGYATLGYIMEKVSGKTYQELLTIYIADKYNLNDTSTKLSKKQNKNLATPYRKKSRNIETKHWNTGKLTPASGIYSNISDLTSIMLQQLKAYRSVEFEKENNPLILTVEKRKKNKDGSYYGMGLWELSFKRGIIYGHSGDMDGFASQYRFNKTQNTGVVILTSSGGEWIGQLIAKISKIIEENEIKTAAAKM